MACGTLHAENCAKNSCDFPACACRFRRMAYSRATWGAPSPIDKRTCTQSCKKYQKTLQTSLLKDLCSHATGKRRVVNIWSPKIRQTCRQTAAMFWLVHVAVVEWPVVGPHWPRHHQFIKTFARKVAKHTKNCKTSLLKDLCSHVTRRMRKMIII